MREIDLKTLRLLVALCDHQTMARAAEVEHIEPSAISKRIAQIEDDLGTPLRVRTRRGVAPTPAGIALLDEIALFMSERENRNIKIDIEQRLSPSSRSSSRRAPRAGACTNV